MNSFDDPNALVITYHIAAFITGAFIVFLGYRLFQSGIYGKSGDLSAKYKGASLILRQSAPGTFFALFGSVVILITIFKGVDLNDHGRTEGATGGFGERMQRFYPLETNDVHTNDPTTSVKGTTNYNTPPN